MSSFTTKHRPLVSIIIPVYNREKMAPDAVESALNQSYPNIQVVVVDDASTDRTHEKLQSFVPSIILIRQPRNRGQSAARNRGLSISTGHYILFLDSDDVLLPDAVEILWKALSPLERNDPAWGVAYGKRITCDKLLNPLKTRHKRFYSGHILDRMLTELFIHTGTYLVRKTAMDEIGGFRENLAVKEDLLVYLFLAAKYKFCFVDQPIVKYRRHPGNRARDNIDSILEQGTSHLDYFFASYSPTNRQQKMLKSQAYAAEHLHIGKTAWRAGLPHAYLHQWKALCALRKRFFFHPKYLFRAVVCKFKTRS